MFGPFTKFDVGFNCYLLFRCCGPPGEEMYPGLWARLCFLGCSPSQAGVRRVSAAVEQVGYGGVAGLMGNEMSFALSRKEGFVATYSLHSSWWE